MVICTTLCMHMRLSGAESDGQMYYSLHAHEVGWSGI